jgi:restriction system protein
MARRRRGSSEDDLAKLIVISAVIAYLSSPWFRQHWPLLVAGVVGLIAAWVVWRIWWRRRTRGMLLPRLAFADRTRGLTPEEFEVACAALFARQGYKTSLTPQSGDDGVDVVLRKDGTKSIVQCKHWPDGSVGAPEVRELLGAKQDQGAVKAFMVTSGGFTAPARELAERNAGVVLWDGPTLRSVASRLVAQDLAQAKWQDEAASPPPVSAATAPVAEPPPVVEEVERVCPKCGGELVERSGRYGRFVGCKGFPKCRYTREITETATEAAEG